MAIIYTYPVKATPVDNDLILISDSADGNKTKQVKVSSLPGGSSAGVSSFNTLTGAVTITAGSNITFTTVGNDISITASSGSTYTAGNGLDLTGTEFSTDLKANGGLVIEATELALDLSASSITGTLAVADGGTGATTLTGILKGNGTSAVTAGAGLGDLSNASFPASTNDASMYIGNGVPSGLIGSPTKTTALGEGAGVATTSGSSNTLIGTNAGIGATTGSTNTLIGTDAGNTLTTGAGNVIIGAAANSNANNVNASIAVGKNTVVSTGSVVIGDGASATGGGIALGRGATNTVANLALGSATYPLLNTTDSGNVNGLGTNQSPAKFIEVQIGATKYYMALYEQA